MTFLWSNNSIKKQKFLGIEINDDKKQTLQSLTIEISSFSGALFMNEFFPTNELELERDDIWTRRGEPIRCTCNDPEKISNNN